jgi:hypothetical protein
MGITIGAHVVMVVAIVIRMVATIRSRWALLIEVALSHTLI